MFDEGTACGTPEALEAAAQQQGVDPVCMAGHCTFEGRCAFKYCSFFFKSLNQVIELFVACTSCMYIYVSSIHECQRDGRLHAE